jgi:plasmid stability protein
MDNGCYRLTRSTEPAVPVTLTIKQVPDELAERLRERAARNRRSLQRELLLILEEAHGGESAPHATGVAIREPGPTTYRKRDVRPRNDAMGGVSGRLSLAELWERARRLGGASASESAALIRRDRDARHGR